MARYGYTLRCEQTQPRPLVRSASLAEQAGFDFFPRVLRPRLP